VSKFLTHIKGWGDNEKLSLKQVTRKVAVLLALVLAHRSWDLVRLSLRGRRHTQDGQQSRPGNLTPEVFVASFKEEAVCPVRCLKVYERLTSAHRKSEMLFLATVSPHNPVSSSSIAR